MRIPGIDHTVRQPTDGETTLILLDDGTVTTGRYSMASMQWETQCGGFVHHWRVQLWAPMPELELWDKDL
jgi:hypothetical protein